MDAPFASRGFGILVPVLGFHGDISKSVPREKRYRASGSGMNSCVFCRGRAVRVRPLQSDTFAARMKGK